MMTGRLRQVSSEVLALIDPATENPDILEVKAYSANLYMDVARIYTLLRIFREHKIARDFKVVKKPLRPHQKEFT